MEHAPRGQPGSKGPLTHPWVLGGPQLPAVPQGKLRRLNSNDDPDSYTSVADIPTTLTFILYMSKPQITWLEKIAYTSFNACLL